MTMKPTTLLFVLAVLFTTASATDRADACLWDNDTIEMEKRGLPGTFELLTGRFLRHSQAYYQWRVVERTKQLVATPNELGLLDDLAVAHDKLGQHDAALKVARQALALSADRYESHANLGTLLVHAGKLTDGLIHIKRAIAINPDAHFGREVVQQRVVEYVLEKRRGDETAPLSFPLADDVYCQDTVQPDGKAREDLKQLCRGQHALNFVDFIKRHDLSVPDAMRGVRGMMRFGNWQSPVLREVLGDLLMGSFSYESSYPSRQLAAMAYLLAGDAASTSRKAYRRHADIALEGQRRGHIPNLDKTLERAVAKGARWFEAVEKREARWIKAGADVDAKYAKAYYLKAAREQRDFAPAELVRPCHHTMRKGLPTKPATFESFPSGLSQEELVDRFGLPECTVKSRWYYTRKATDGEQQLLVSFKKGKVDRVLGRVVAGD